MDGSFDPSETGSGDSNERNVEISSESSVLTLESNCTLTHANGSSTSMENYETLQIYQDLGGQSQSVIQISTNQGAKIDRTSRGYQLSHKIRYIDENTLFDITKLEGSDGRHKKGSNGEIYTAEWRENENRIVFVAIKKEKGTKTEKEGKVYREAEKLSNLKHEHIIEFFAMVYQPNSVDWLVMELGDCSLKEFLNDLRRLLNSLEDYDLRDILPYRQCIEYFLQIVRAMKEAHSKNIIHADLNSNNIVFKKRPDTIGQMKASILKIIDFSDENKTNGTATHMAPELWSNGTPNKQIDVYSAGVILIELMTLKVLFDGFEWYNIVYFHEQGRTLLDENEEWPKSIKEILRRCLNREASRRPSFEEILEDLENIRDEFPSDDDNEEEGEEDGVESENFYNEEENNAENNDEDNNESSSNASQLDGAPIPSSLI